MQAYKPILDAMDQQLLTVSGIYGSGTNKNFIQENSTFDLQAIDDPTGQAYVRSTLIPIAPETSTIGVNGLDRVAGIYAVDVFGPLDEGYTTVLTMADAVIAAFARGTILPLSNGEQITIMTAGWGPNVTQGAWNTNKWFAVQVQVRYEGYMAA